MYYLFLVLYLVTPRSHEVCVISSSEDQQIIQKLELANWDVLPVAGCGYKLLCVIDGLADAFVLSRPSSYKWDTCGPQAILKAMGGNIMTFNTNKELLYNEPHNGEGGGDKWANKDGIIAYRSRGQYLLLCSVMLGIDK